MRFFVGFQSDLPYVERSCDLLCCFKPLIKCDRCFLSELLHYLYDLPCDLSQCLFMILFVSDSSFHVIFSVSLCVSVIFCSLETMKQTIRHEDEDFSMQRQRKKRTPCETRESVGW